MINGMIFNELINNVIKRLLKELGYGYRKQSKQLATGKYAHRDEQFKIICSLILVMSLDSPVLSIDCKKKDIQKPASPNDIKTGQPAHARERKRIQRGPPQQRSSGMIEKSFSSRDVFGNR